MIHSFEKKKVHPKASPIAQLIKESACNVGDPSLTPGLGRSPGEGKGYPLQYSGLENSMDVPGVAKSRTQLSNIHFHFLSLQFTPLRGGKKFILKLTAIPEDTLIKMLHLIIRTGSVLQLCATSCPRARQAPESRGVSSQECSSGLPCPPPGDLPNVGIEPESPALQQDFLPLRRQESLHLILCLCVLVAQSHLTL